MSAHNSLVATYADHHLARGDIDKLHHAGFDMNKLRLVAEDDPGAMDGVPVLASLGQLDLALCECIPEQDIVAYESELKAGRWILVAHGTLDEIEQARSIAESTHSPGWRGRCRHRLRGCAD